ncbi:MAG: hypothetical protein ACOH10_09640 [Rhodoglobus sp.]
MAQRGTGIALVAAGIALAATTILELAVGDARGDGDNPADSLRYLSEFGQLYVYSGFALVAGGVALVAGVLGVLRFVGMPSLAFGTASTFGVLAGGFLAVGGVMRMQANGTVPHIQNLNESWGESAYLVVQIAGTQGVLSTGMMATAAWLVSLAILLFRRGSRALALLAILPATMFSILLLDLLVPSLATSASASEVVFLAYLASAFAGIPIACIGFGIALTSTSVQARLRAGVPTSESPQR